MRNRKSNFLAGLTWFLLLQPCQADSQSVTSQLDDVGPSRESWSFEGGYRNLQFAKVQNLFGIGVGHKMTPRNELNISAVVSPGNPKVSGQSVAWRWYFADVERSQLRLFLEPGYNLVTSPEGNVRDMSAALGGLLLLERNFGLAMTLGIAGIDRALPFFNTAMISTLYSSRLTITGSWMYQ